jgi:hypothetical protein
MMDVLFRFVRVMPDDFLLESAAVGIVLEPDNLRSHDALEGVEQRSCTHTFERIGPVRTFPKADGVVIAVSKAETQQQPSCGLDAQRVHQLLAQQAHCRRTQDHDPLLVQSNDALVGAKVEQLCKVQLRNLRQRLGTTLHSVDSTA